MSSRFDMSDGCDGIFPLIAQGKNNKEKREIIINIYKGEQKNSITGITERTGGTDMKYTEGKNADNTGFSDASDTLRERRKRRGMPSPIPSQGA
jgi:hypothetical protein